MNKTSQRMWLIVTIVFAIAVMTFTLPQMVMHPWNVVPELDADGGKNIYTYLFHILYEKGIWFYGMNYPYGEHVVYADAQPLLSVPLSYIKHITLGEALAAMEWLMVLTYIIAIVYVYKILLHFAVRPFIAMFFAGLIIVFTPQIFCVRAHYSLSYACVVPMLFFWTIKYNISGQWKYAVYVFIFGCFFSFLHPYFSALIFMWILGYAVGYCIFIKRKLIDRLKHVLPLLLSAVAMFALIGIVMKLTDPLKDRPLVPFGMLSACANIQGIYTSQHSPVWMYIKEKAPHITVYEGVEGFTYPGLAIIIVVLISLTRSVALRLKKNTASNIVHDDQYFRIWLFIAFATLLFSMGAPFTWHMEWLLDYLSFFRQFRTLDRFSWIFYYIITIYGVVVINTWFVKYLHAGKKAAAYFILITAMALWSFEASGYVIYQRAQLGYAYDNIEVIDPRGNITWAGYLKEHHYLPSDFQAVLIFRFFEIGSEKLWIDDDGNNICTIGIYSAMQLHLPLIDGMMSRTSWSVAEKEIKINAGPYVHKPILDDIKSDKPFLILHRESDVLNPDQEYLFEASDSIGHFQTSYVYACYPARLRANDKKHADAINAVAPYLRTGKDSCIKYTGSWFANHFDSITAPEVLFGSGAVPQMANPETVITTIPIRPAYNNQAYEFSCWFLMSRENYYSPYYKIQLSDSSGKEISTTDVFVKESLDNHGLWFRSGIFLAIPADCRSVKCTLYSDIKDCYRVMDELMLRPADAVIVSKDANGNIMVNNHLFKASDGY